MRHTSPVAPEEASDQLSSSLAPVLGCLRELVEHGHTTGIANPITREFHLNLLSAARRGTLCDRQSSVDRARNQLALWKEERIKYPRGVVVNRTSRTKTLQESRISSCVIR